jgi:hypothetical protein
MDPSVRSPDKICTKLRVVYFEDSDCMSIAHLTQDGELLSEACLSLEEGYEYAKSIIAVFDEALGL